MSAWHHFVPSSEDDSYCTNDGCLVVVSDDALGSYSAACPAPPCDSPLNDGTCVFVPGEHGPVCAYCELAGCKDTGPEPDDDEDDPAET